MALAVRHQYIIKVAPGKVAALMALLKHLSVRLAPEEIMYDGTHYWVFPHLREEEARGLRVLGYMPTEDEASTINDVR